MFINVLKIYFVKFFYITDVKIVQQFEKIIKLNEQKKYSDLHMCP